MVCVPALGVPTAPVRSGVLDVQAADSDPVADVGYGSLTWFSNVFPLPAGAVQPRDRLRIVVGGTLDTVGAVGVDFGVQIGGVAVAGAVGGSANGAGSWRIEIDATRPASGDARVSWSWSVVTASGASLTGGGVATVPVPFGDAAIVRAGVRFTVADPGNTATQTMRSVELLAARVLP